MSFPAGASTITLTGTFPVPVAGTARAGRVILTPSARLVDSTQKAIYSGGGSIVLDNAGHFSVLLLCTDDTDVKPEGWRWRVDEQPSGGPRATYWIDLPHTLGSTVDLAKLAEVDAPDGSGSSSPAATPTGPAGGALDGTYPNPVLSAETIAAFDTAGAASTALTVAVADATAKVASHAAASDPHGDRAAASAALAAHAVDSTDVHGITDTAALETQAGAQAKANSAQTAATAAAAGDATAKVTAHTSASDPHGDRAAAGSALGAHEADTTSVHGIANTAALETATGAQAKASAAQTAAEAYADTVAATKAALVHAAQHTVGGSDPVALTQAQIVGLTSALAALLPLLGGTVTGDLLLHGANLTVGRGDDTGAYRFRVTGSGLDLEIAGLDVFISKWSGADFTGTQSNVMRWEAAGPHLIGNTQFGTGPFDTVHSIDAGTGVAALGAKNALANLRFCGRQATPGSPSAGTWATGDTIQDSAGVFWLCTAGGTPGTWASSAPAAGGGSSIRTAAARVTDDNLSGLPSAAAWTIAQTSAGTQLKASIAAAAGDRIRVVGRFMRSGSHFLDWVLLDSAGAIAVYAGTDSGSPLGEGDPALYPSLSFGYDPGPPMFTVGAGHIDGAGTATIALAHQGTGTGLVYAHSTYPWKVRLENIGPEPA